MFGTYRTILALMVVALHLGGVPSIGAYAVFGFYTLSGYLMTLIMQNSYGYTRKGFFKYSANRFLRIYPIYWFSILLSLAIIAYVGESYSSFYHHSLFFPNNSPDILRNIFIFFPLMESPRLTPPAWALTVEIFFYICIGLGISKNKKIVLCWFLISIAYHIFAVSFGKDNYYTIFAASLPFAIGAIIYHYYDNLIKYFIFNIRFIDSFLPIIVFFCLLLNWLVGYKLNALNGVFFYLNLAICAVIVLLLSKRKSLPLISRQFDTLIGGLSYPIYLIHYQIGLLLMVFFTDFGFNYERPDLVFMFHSLPFIIFTSWIIHILVEEPIEFLRKKIKTS